MHKKRWTKPGMEEQMAAIKSSGHAVRVEQLRDVGSPIRSRVIPHGKDKARCPRRQRKQRKWDTE
jgi:hypothetical protein